MTTMFSLIYLSVLCALVPSTMAYTTTGSPPNPGTDSPRFVVGDGLDPGVMAGVGVAGGIVIIALILLAIYCCVRARNVAGKDQDHVGNNYTESSVYTSGTSQAIFPSGNRHQKGKYGSMEDIKSTTSSQEKNNGAYANPAYTKEPGEKQSERRASFGKARKAGFANDAYDHEDSGRKEQPENSWEEKETSDANGNKRMSRKDISERGSLKPAKSAMKKRTEIEMNQVNSQPVNGILKTRSHSPNRSQTSSTDASLDANVAIYGYSHQGKDQPNVKHKPVIERRRSRSGTRSHRSGSSGGHSRRSQSPDKKKIKTGRMYTSDVFIDDRKSRSRSSGRRTRSDSSRRTRSERTSDSVDSGSSTASQSRKVSMNPGGKRVHIKGEETDI